MEQQQLLKSDFYFDLPEELIAQKPLTQAYVVDQVRDKMIGNEAAIGVIYSGEAIYTQRENSNLEYVIPKEGTNVWIDSWCILKDAENKENAEKLAEKLLINWLKFQMMKNNTAPKAIICLNAEPIIATGAIMSDIPMVDSPAETKDLVTGTLVEVDGDNGTIEIL